MLSNSEDQTFCSKKKPTQPTNQIQNDSPPIKYVDFQLQDQGEIYSYTLKQFTYKEYYGK